MSNPSQLVSIIMAIYNRAHYITEALNAIKKQSYTNWECLIIDDGSHINSHIITTSNFLFPFLNKGGVYVVEDLKTSYWSSFFGGGNRINYMEFMIDDYKPSYFDRNILSMHFYHNMVFIMKGDNIEKCNYLINNRIPNNE